MAEGVTGVMPGIWYGTATIWHKHIRGDINALISAKR